MTMNKKLLLSIFFLTTLQLCMSQSTAEYDISFTSTWSNATHPDPNFPGSAHWSDLVGATHNSSVVFVEMGQPATTGIKDVAELGDNTNFQAEVTAAINASTADQWLRAPFSPFGAIGTATMSDVLVSADHPLLSLAAMIAPSPDWMIAVNSISLLDDQGNWIPVITMDLYPYDAGTDLGTHYNSSDMPDADPDPISSLQNVIPFSNEKVGTLTIALKPVLSNEDITENRFEVYPNPSNGIFKINAPGTTQLSNAKIYNMLGGLVSTKNLDNTTEATIDLSQLVSGIYLLQITSDDEAVSTRRVIIQ